LNAPNLKIAFDASPLFGIKAGIYQYVSNLSDSLRHLDDDIEIDFYLGSSWSKKDLDINYSNYSPYSLNIIKSAFDIFGEKGKLIRKNINYIYQKRMFYGGLKKYKPDIVHFTGNCIYMSDIPTIFTFYDLSCFRFPETHPYSRVAWQEKHIPKALEQSSHIITISQFSKNELVSYFGVNPERISVIYCGVNDFFYPVDKDAIKITLSNYSLQYKQYILSVGTIEPRKNLNTIIQAYSKLPKDIQDNYSLVIVGAYGWKQSDIILQHSHLIENGKLVFLGYVKQAHLPAVISGASLVAYPSRYEGFGLPVLESMACGTPVISSNSSSMPEILNDPDILLDPDNIPAWTEIIKKVLSDNEYSENLSKQGLERAKNFSWHSCADQTFKTYNTLIKHF